jgi:TfoX/Sxy family transcriptional regulator of competence genes
MPFDENLGARVRSVLSDRTDVVEKRMFGGLAFMVSGRMCCGIIKNDLMLRVGPQRLEQLLKKPHARVMDFTGRPSQNMIYVSPAGLRTEAALRTWVGQSLDWLSDDRAANKPKAKKPTAKTPTAKTATAKKRKAASA